MEEKQIKVAVLKGLTAHGWENGFGIIHCIIEVWMDYC